MLKTRTQKKKSQSFRSNLTARSSSRRGNRDTNGWCSSLSTAADRPRSTTPHHVNSQFSRQISSHQSKIYRDNGRAKTRSYVSNIVSEPRVPMISNLDESKSHHELTSSSALRSGLVPQQHRPQAIQGKAPRTSGESATVNTSLRTFSSGAGPDWSRRSPGDFGNADYLTKMEPLAKYSDVTYDPPQNHQTLITPEAIRHRTAHKYNPPPYPKDINPDHFETDWDAIVIGAGHNGLVCANYLAAEDMRVLVIERRHLVGGAAVTEEIYPGFKYSRASYLAGLFRPSIIKDLELEELGFEYLPRDPSSFTPTLEHSPHRGKSLILGGDKKATFDSIAQFSLKDADKYFEYEEFLEKCRDIIDPLLEIPLPLEKNAPLARQYSLFKELYQTVKKHNNPLTQFTELATSSAKQTLDRWFESDILKATLATDAVIGSPLSPASPGSGYVLLHHVMGEAAGKRGVWAYMRGGMGTITRTLADRAVSRGVSIITNTEVEEILTADLVNPPLPNSQEVVSNVPIKEMTDPMPMGIYGLGGRPTGIAKGVKLTNGDILHAPIIISNSTPYHTFIELMQPTINKHDQRTGTTLNEHAHLPSTFIDRIRFTDYSCSAMKINLAVNKLPDFFCMRNKTTCNFNVELQTYEPGIQHRGTIHFEDKIEDIERAYLDTLSNRPATRPVIEMTIPSSLDDTLAPAGSHVVQLFVQYAPYHIHPSFGSWSDESFKLKYSDHIFSIIDQYCDGFSSSILHRDVLSPLDLERIFGLHQGNIFHGGLTLNQIGYNRPAPGYAHHRTPVQGLYLCGSGVHPGGGVMGSPGRNCAHIVIEDSLQDDGTSFF